MSDEQQDEQQIVYENESEETDKDFDLEEGGDSGQIRDKIKKIKERLIKCNEDKQEYLAGWQRAQADFINYRKRQEEQMKEWLKMAEAGLIGDLLPVLDALDAVKNNPFLTSDIQGGVNSIRKQLTDILDGHGLEEIKAVGEKFNPEFHEAVERVESGEEEGVVTEEIQNGYLLNGKVIRTSKVKVSK
ncbi:MAG: nucleotide exchange factor GrpE [Candidatus Portnoybacteria bacterium]|nr:nucleotide exchange factor GrpE [Candidatus Portnoybacteria bacterium]